MVWPNGAFICATRGEHFWTRIWSSNNSSDDAPPTVPWACTCCGISVPNKTVDAPDTGGLRDQA
jgi:hypothetical protein